MPTDSEISAMYNFVEFMKPFVQMTEAIGGEKWVTISSMRSLIHKIRCFCLAYSYSYLM